MTTVTAPVTQMPEFDYRITYYLSGPMAGYPEFNFPMFQKAMEQLTASGINILSPHQIKHAKADQPWEEFLRVDLIEMLQECAGIILLPGWPQSKGARMELDAALKLSWPVYYYDPETMTLVNMNRSAA